MLTDEQELYDSASDRLDTYRKWIAIATLRAFEVEGTPDQYTGEPLDSEGETPIERCVLILCQAYLDASFIDLERYLNKCPSMGRPFHSFGVYSIK
jgi:hypothetical protein